MKDLQRGSLLLLITLLLWALAIGASAPAMGGSAPEPGAQGANDASSDGPAPPPREPAEREEEVQPPGREDPDRFYRKPPRKPRELRQVNA